MGRKKNLLIILDIDNLILFQFNIIFKFIKDTYIYAANNSKTHSPWELKLPGLQSKYLLEKCTKTLSLS